MSLLEQDIIKKRRLDDENTTKLDAGNKNKKYKIEAI